MQYICGRSKMQEIDKYTIEKIGIPSAVLMERAALSVFEEIKKRFEAGSRCLVLVGSGNNGGDGLALARMLSEAGYQVQVLLVGDHRRSTECEAQLTILRNMKQLNTDSSLYVSKLTSSEEIENIAARQYDVVVDSIFGIGLTRDVTSIEREVIEAVNDMDTFRVAVDIASGLDADTGMIRGMAFMAELTVTFGYAKQGMYLGEGPNVTGELMVADIGFPRMIASEIGVNTCTYDIGDINKLPKRVKTSNKGTYGRVCVIAGCDTMAGAAYFSGAAAYRSGAGLVKIYSHSANRDILLSKLPEAIFEAYDTQKIEQDTEQNFETAAKQVITSAVQFGDVLVVGPGLGRSLMAEALVRHALSQCDIPVVLDADGLNILSEHMEWLLESQTRLVLTPHLKEMERLSGASVAKLSVNTMEHAKAFAQKYNVTCVLKGAHTIVADDTTYAYINTTGNNGMSTGGTGDVLTGVIAAYIAAGLSLTEAARLGVMIHGMAGDEAAIKLSERGMLAGDMLDGLSRLHL